MNETKNKNLKFMIEKKKVVHAYCLDLPRETKVVNFFVLQFYGWVIREDNLPNKKMRIKVGEKNFPVETCIDRVDVFGQYQDFSSAKKSGFTSMPQLKPGKNKVEIQIFIEGDTWHTFYSNEYIYKKSKLFHYHFFKYIFVLMLPELKFLPKRLYKVNSIQEIESYLSYKKIKPLYNFKQHKPKKVIHEELPETKFSKEQLPKIGIVTPSYNQGIFLRIRCKVY